MSSIPVCTAENPDTDPDYPVPLAEVSWRRSLCASAGCTSAANMNLRTFLALEPNEKTNSR
jgi:hypothetical protein